MSPFAADTVRCLIARRRVSEMLARGWTIVGPGEEGSLLMEGPEVGGGFQPLDRLTSPALAAAWDHAMERLDRRIGVAA